MFKAASGSSPAGGRDRFWMGEAGAHKGRRYNRRRGDPRGRPWQSLRNEANILRAALTGFGAIPGRECETVPQGCLKTESEMHLPGRVILRRRDYQVRRGLPPT